jgi:hypothetical protein
MYFHPSAVASGFLYSFRFNSVQQLSRSSPLEAILLKATWPSEQAIPKALLKEIVTKVVPLMERAGSTGSSSDDPYFMVLHKLWTKMCEKDWRTVVKSLHILLTISRDCPSKSSEKISETIKYLISLYSCFTTDLYIAYYDPRCIKCIDALQRNDANIHCSKSGNTLF